MTAFCTVQQTSRSKTDNSSRTGCGKSSSMANASSATHASSGETRWPDSLRKYVARCFANIEKTDYREVESKLKELLAEAFQAGTIWTNDWDLMLTPLQMKESSAHLISTSSASPTGTRVSLKTKKRKNVPIGSTESSTEKKARDRRSQRFESGRYFSQLSSNLEQAAHAIDSGEDSVTNVIVGRSQALEKKYLRLTSAPDPDLVRPLPVLKKALEFLKAKWVKDNNYAYICDQFKSLRQDLTVQRIANEFTVRVYETHARIALEKGDIGEYNQCQGQLLHLYEQGLKGCKNEFTAYKILYFLYTQNRYDINKAMAKLTAEEKDHAGIAHALQVRSSLAKQNYHRFFRLYMDAPGMGGYLMDQFVDRERARAICAICKAYRPDLDVRFVTEILGFEGDHESITFLQLRGVEPYVRDNKLRFDTKSPQTLEAFEKMHASLSRIDIKGQL